MKLPRANTHLQEISIQALLAALLEAMAPHSKVRFSANYLTEVVEWARDFASEDSVPYHFSWSRWKRAGKLMNLLLAQKKWESKEKR